MKRKADNFVVFTSYSIGEGQRSKVFNLLFRKNSFKGSKVASSPHIERISKSRDRMRGCPIQIQTLEAVIVGGRLTSSLIRADV